jgi:hypothetical protein
MKFLLFIMMFALLSHQSAENAGRISGAVFDSTNGKSLSGIRIHILNTTHQQLSDDNGAFEFKNLIPGIYELEFKSIWYHTLTLESVEVKAGELTSLKVSVVKNELELPNHMDSIARGRRGVRSNMKILKPNPGIDYKILVIEPDSTIDYKIIVVKPRIFNDEDYRFDR